MTDLTIERVDIHQLDPNPWNPNRQSEAVTKATSESIEEFGFIDPVTVRIVEGRYQIIDGEHRWRQAVEQGHPDIPVVVKPTNWVNPLLPRLCAPGRIDHAVFVSMKRRHYLGATFRGGIDRLAFCARLAGQTAPVVPHGAALMHAAIESTSDPFGRMARIMALLHWLQESLFEDAIARNGWPDALRIDFDDTNRTRGGS